MKILIAGGTGFIGQHLIGALRKDKEQHTITLLSRKASASSSASYTMVAWDNPQLPDIIQNQDVIINLCGEPIFDKRWTSAQKKQLEDSRISTTRRLVTMMNQKPGPHTLIQASAIGFYGTTAGDSFLDEAAPSGKDFLSQLCRRWEGEARKLKDGTRLVIVRFGVVLGRNGGAFPKMIFPFSLGMGGPIGSGRQWFSWIHVSDLADMICKCVRTPHFRGIVNGTAPEPMTNKQAMVLVGQAMNRPSFVKTPAWIMHLLLGERAFLLNRGQRVIPKRARDLDFIFKYPVLEKALEDLLTHDK